MSSILPGDHPYTRLQTKDAFRVDDWDSKLVTMFERWRSAEYVRETTKLVRMKLDRYINGDAPELIVPDRPQSSGKKSGKEKKTVPYKKDKNIKEPEKMGLGTTKD